MHLKALKANLIIVISVAGLHAIGSQNVQPIPRLTTPIEFDGIISAGEWSMIDTLSMVSHWPTYSQTPNLQSEIRVAYDDRFFYLSALCHDNPELIQTPTYERDEIGMTMDQVVIILDSYNDNENGTAFVVTPTGSRTDMSIRNDAQGDEPIDISWNSYWDAKVNIDSAGWTVEMRIPFSSLRFQQSGDQITMGMIVYRYVARNRQMDIFPNIPPDWGFWSFIKVSQAQDIATTGIQSSRPWFTSPYILAGLGHHHEKLDGLQQLEKFNDDQVTVGLDIQHAVTDNMNLDLTLNTDFAQVEADDQVVNLSRFSLFFPEKRRFFLERSSIMDFEFDDNNRLFYSRKIGINDGRIIPLWGGARLVGRMLNYDIGLMAIQSRKKFDFNSENFGIIRLRRKISRSNSYIGGILTSRTDFNGNHNLTYGVDGIIQLYKNDYLKVNLARTWESNDTVDYKGFFDDRKRLYLKWENRSQVGFNYSLSYSQVDKNYEPGIGFEARRSFKAVGDRVAYGWFPKAGGSLRFVKFDVQAKAFFSDRTSQLESLLIQPSFSLEWRRYNRLMISVTRFKDRPGEPFDLSDNITIGAREYVNSELNLYYQTPPVNFLYSEFGITYGSFYGGERLTAFVAPTLIVSKHLAFQGFYQYNSIAFDDLPDYLAHVARLKIRASLNVKLSVNTFVQINTLTKVSAINFRLRYNPADGNDLYVVYNELLNNKGGEQPLSDARGVLVKYVHTFHLGK